MRKKHKVFCKRALTFLLALSLMATGISFEAIAAEAGELRVSDILMNSGEEGAPGIPEANLEENGEAVLENSGGNKDESGSVIPQTEDETIVSDESEKNKESLNGVATEAPVVQEETIYFKDGAEVTGNEVPLGYDGYVTVKTEATTVTVTPTAAEGYEFMLLSLTDDSGNVTTPLTKDYKKGTDGEGVQTGADYSYSFTVDSNTSTDITWPLIGTVYSTMPTITAFFDATGNVLNGEFPKLVKELNQQNAGKPNSVTSWLGPMDGYPLYGTLHTGSRNDAGTWNGVDSKKGDYAVYYAGDGKAFSITGINAYSRLNFADNRFESQEGTFPDACIATNFSLNENGDIM